MQCLVAPDKPADAAHLVRLSTALVEHHASRFVHFLEPLQVPSLSRARNGATRHHSLDLEGFEGRVVYVQLLQS